MCIFHVSVYISDFGVDIFLCTRNMHFPKCVYTPPSLNPCTSTLSSCHSGGYGLPLTGWKFRVSI